MAQDQTLWYAKQARPSPRRLIARALLTCFAVAACILGVRQGCSTLYYWDHNRVKAHLQAVPNVTLTRIDAYDDGPELKVVYAAISIDNKPNSLLRFQSPTTLLDGKHVRLNRIGPHHLWVSGYGYWGAVDSATGKPVPGQFYQDYFDIGPAGWFSDLAGVEIKSASDVVQNYDRLLAAIQAMPKEGQRKLKDGSQVDYKILGP